MASKFIGDHHGDGANLTNVNADTVDGIQASQLVRNDVNAQTIARHLDANTTWGSPVGDTLFLGWYSDRVVIGNDTSSVHNTAINTALNSIVMGNPTYFHSSAKFANNIDMGSQVGTWIESDVMSDAIGWNATYGTYIGSNIGGTHYLRGNGTFTTGGSTYNLWHAGNDGSGSGLDADLLDGIDSNLFARRERSNTSSTAVGWYTIAVNGGDRASAKFHITDTTSGAHQSVHFHASHMFGSGNAIGILHNNFYSTSPMRYIRIKEGGTYDGALLQVYFDSAATVTTTMYEDVQSSGWTVLANPVADGTNPGGVSNFAALTTVAAQVDIDLASRGGIVTTGNIHAQGDVTAYSDKRLKENIVKIEGALDKVSSINGYTYDRIDTNEKQVGVVAQEVLAVMPELVKGDEEGLYSVAYGNMAGLFIEAIKELKAELEAVKADNAELRKLLDK